MLYPPVTTLFIVFTAVSIFAVVNDCNKLKTSSEVVVPSACATISAVIFLVMGWFVYDTFFVEEEVEEVIVETKKEAVMNKFQRILFERYKQRKLLDMMEEEYSTGDFYENMFSSITSIKIDREMETYSFTKSSLFNMIDEGYLKDGQRFVKNINLKELDNRVNIYKFTRDIIANEKKYYDYLWTGVATDDAFDTYLDTVPFNSPILNKYLEEYTKKYKNDNIVIRNDNIYNTLTDIFKTMGIEAEQIDLKESHFKYTGVWTNEMMNRFLKVIKLNNILLENFNAEKENGEMGKAKYSVSFYFILENKITNDYNKDKQL